MKRLPDEVIDDLRKGPRDLTVALSQEADRSLELLREWSVQESPTEEFTNRVFKLYRDLEPVDMLDVWLRFSDGRVSLDDSLKRIHRMIWKDLLGLFGVMAGQSLSVN
jgi:hypothetical protein